MTTPLRRHMVRSLPNKSTARTRLFSTSHARRADFDHVVIGAGAVGLAIARELASREGTSTLLVERHGMVGSETSSRNSEVIHAGLYYGHDTLKTSLCLEGKHMLYELCAARGIPHRNTKKWIVAQDEQQMGELEKVHAFARSIGVPTRFLPRDEAAAREPGVRARAGVLESESTGIVDSHALMAYLEGSFVDRGGELALHTGVAGLEYSAAAGEYTLHTQTTPSAPGEAPVPNDPITTTTLVNSAGLAAIDVSNLLLPASHRRVPFYAKGSYFSYALSHPKVSTLIYPAPVPGLGGLGTHLTLDLAGRIRFGPDVEWVADPTDLAPNPSRLADAVAQIRTYLPDIDAAAVALDYCGIRPKLGRTSGTAGPNFADFYIKEEAELGFKGFVNLLGIESPGLTSSLAIGRYVRGILYGSGQEKGRGEEALDKSGEVRFEFAQ